jgi:DNA-binding MarR family transcriptional regulator
MYRSDEDLELLAELAGVLDQTVNARGLSAGGYLVLRELARDPATRPVTGLAQTLSAAPDEVADLAGRLVADGLAETRPDGVCASDTGRTRAEELETEANEAMRAYVMQRPHTATVYGLVASMQSGRFTVEDLLEFIAEGADTDDDDTQ